ncbi:MAG TPA: isoprenyl transferase [bacterium]|jgi:undecaprenyl diphosphate synthase|nr:isoprenyl transferase [bacterium]
MAAKYRAFKDPQHVAIIMDGNGRWAQERGWPRLYGHRAGLEAVRRLVKCAVKYKLKYLTLFAFSTENWRRPRLEVEGLFALLQEYVEKETVELMEQGVRVRFLGERGKLPSHAKKVVSYCENQTEAGSRLNLNVALNYGSRGEILQAVRKVAANVELGKLKAANVCVADFESQLFTYGLPDPDLLIRTGGENRLSNFLLWQSAYTELYFTTVFWPDFSEEHLAAALSEYRRRERRFGAIADRG